MTISQVVRKVESTLESFAELYSTPVEEGSTRPFILYEDDYRATQRREIPTFFSSFHELEQYLLLFIQSSDDSSPRYPLLLLLLHKLHLSLSSLHINNNNNKNNIENYDNDDNEYNDDDDNNEYNDDDDNNDGDDERNEDEDNNENAEKKEEINGEMRVGGAAGGEIGAGRVRGGGGGGRKECGICLSDVDDHDFVTTYYCDHKYCRYCVEGHMEQLIENGKVENIRCLDCNSFFTADQIKEIVNERSYEKYAKFSLIAQLKGDVTARFCPRCGVGRKGEAEGLRIRCEECQQEYCFDCKVAWHENISCAQQQKILFKQQKKAEKRFKKMGAKRCPHCGDQTIRYGGSLDMLCQSCNKYWNWAYDAPLNDSYRKDETLIEKVAFYYPRGVKNCLESRERENDNGDYKIAATIGIIGVVGVPLTVICSPPAVAIRAARKAKRKLKNNKK